MKFDLKDNKSARFTWTETRSTTCHNSDYVDVVNNAPNVNPGPKVLYTCNDGDNTVTMQAGDLNGNQGVWSKVDPDAAGNFVGDAAKSNAVFKFAATDEDLSVKLRWTVTTADGECSNHADITLVNQKFTPAITVEKNVCGTDTTILGTEPNFAHTGEWSYISSGNVTFEDKTNADTKVKGLIPGETARVVWTIINTNGKVCKENYATTTLMNIMPSYAKILSHEGQEYCGKEGEVIGLKAKALSGDEKGKWTANKEFTVANNATDEAEITFTSLANDEIRFTWTVYRDGHENCISEATTKLVNNTIDMGEGITSSEYTCDGTAELIASNYKADNSNSGIMRGEWTAENSSLVIDKSTSYNEAKVSGLPPKSGEKFTWTVFKGRCSESKEITITNYEVTPVVYEVEPVCKQDFNKATLRAETLSSYGTVGTDVFGRWEADDKNPVATAIKNSDNNVTVVEGLTKNGEYKYTWTVYRKVAGIAGEDGYTDGGICHDTRTVIVNNNTVTAVADTRFRGKENASDNKAQISVCGPEFQMLANTQSNSTGTWTLSDGSSAETYIAASDSHSPTATVRNIPNEGITLKWTVRRNDGSCEDADEIKIVNEKLQAVASADPTTCNSLITLNTNNTLDDDHIGIWSTNAAGSFSSTATESTATGMSVTYHIATKGAEVKFHWNYTVKNVTVTDGQNHNITECPSDDYVVTVRNNDYVFGAGNDATADRCSRSYKLHGFMPEGATGTWSGTPTFANANDPTTTVSGLSNAVDGNTLTWTVVYKGCEKSDDVVIYSNDVDEPVIYTQSQSVCSPKIQMDANTPVIGEGYWKYTPNTLGFEGTKASTDANLTFNNLPQNSNATFVWVIEQKDQNGDVVCHKESDVVTISNMSYVATVTTKEQVICKNYFEGLTATDVVTGYNAEGWWTADKPNVYFGDVSTTTATSSKSYMLY